MTQHAVSFLPSSFAHTLHTNSHMSVKLLHTVCDVFFAPLCEKLVDRPQRQKSKKHNASNEALDRATVTPRAAAHPPELVLCIFCLFLLLKNGKLFYFIPTPTTQLPLKNIWYVESHGFPWPFIGTQCSPSSEKQK